MQVLILAGGFGSRLMPIINDRPKVMAPINGKPFLEIILESLREKGVRNIILTLGYLSDYILGYFGSGKSLGLRISYSIENMPLGTAGAVRNAYDKLERTFIVMNGDTVIDLDYHDLFRFHRSHPGEITMVLTKQASLQEGGVVRLNKKEQITDFKELDKNKQTKKCFINAGVYVLDKSIVRMIRRGVKMSLETEFFPHVLKLKKPIYGYVICKNFIDIGTPSSYKKACSVLKVD